MLFEQPKVIICSLRSGAKPVPKGYTAVRVDRKTIFGNPFHIEDCGSRTDCLDEHSRWFKQQVRDKTIVAIHMNKLVKRIRKGEKIALMCWCVPKRCHAEAYKSYLLSKLEK